MRLILKYYFLIFSLFLTQPILAAYCSDQTADDCSFNVTNETSTYNVQCFINFDNTTTSVNPGNFILSGKGSVGQTSVKTTKQSQEYLSFDCNYYNINSKDLAGTCSLEGITITKNGLISTRDVRCTTSNFSMTVNSNNFTSNGVVNSQINFKLNSGSGN